MDLLTVVSSAAPPLLTSVPANSQHSVGFNGNDVGFNIRPTCESTSMIFHKMDAGTNETIQTKSAKAFSPGISRSSPNSLSNEISGQTGSVGVINNGSQSSKDEMQEKGESTPGTKPSSELCPQFNLNYSLGTCSDVTQSCSSSNVGSLPNLSNVSTSCVQATAPGSASVATFITPSSQTSKISQQGLRSDLPQPPKKPLSPYMRFSKEIWQQVKTANPGMSVCEVGATIGRIWRELDDANKKRFVQEFTNDKTRYDTELQGYLRTNGLQPSDIIKPRAKKTPKDPASAKRSKGQNQKNHEAQHDLAPGTNCHQPTATAQCPTSEVQQMSYAGAEHGNQEMSVTLPSFSQVWSNPDATTQQRDLLAQVVYDSQLHEERDASAIDSASQGITMFPNQAQLDASSVPPAVISNDQKIQQLKVPASDAANWWWPVENNERYLGTNALQQTVNAAVQPHSGGGSSFTEVALKTGECAPNKASEAMGSNCNWNEGGGITVCKSTAVGGGVWLSRQPDGAQRVQNASEEKGAAVDAEKLFLRGALVEKTQEVVQLMRELEQAYGLIHQLKTQNDFFHRWYQEQRSAQE